MRYSTILLAGVFGITTVYMGYEHRKNHIINPSKIESILELTGEKANQTIGDYNSDRKLDLIIATESPSELNIYSLMGDGNGHFEKQRLIAKFPDHINGIISSGDYNNDGNLDLLITANSDKSKVKSYILFGDGKGNFPYQK